MLGNMLSGCYSKGEGLCKLTKARRGKCPSLEMYMCVNHGDTRISTIACRAIPIEIAVDFGFGNQKPSSDPGSGYS